MQHHPARRGRLHRIGLQPGFDIVTDPDPTGFPSPWRTYRLALEQTPAAASHRLVVQDDARVVPGFETQAFQAVQERPSDLVSFYCGVYPRENAIDVVRAQEAGRRWSTLYANSWIPVVALCWPRELVDRFLSYAPPGDDPVRWSDDANVGDWIRAERLPLPLCRVPTLVDHDPDGGSLIGGGRGRHGIGFG